MSSPGDATPHAAATPARQTLDERYGVRSPRQRRLLQLGVAVVALVLLGWLGWAAWEHGRADVTGELHGYDVVSAHRLRVVVDITRRHDQPAVCDVTAQADDHTTVGEGQVRVASGDDQVRVTATIRTERKAVSATVSNCRIAN